MRCTVQCGGCHGCTAPCSVGVAMDAQHHGAMWELDAQHRTVGGLPWMHSTMQYGGLVAENHAVWETVSTATFILNIEITYIL